MIPKILKWMVIILATLNYGFMCYDGSRALMVGDYVRPQTGEHAGQLGSWKHVAEAVNIEPESSLMKSIFLIWGSLGLVLMVCYAMEVRGIENVLIVFNIASLWYLVMGTIAAAIQVILLLILRFKK